MAIGAISANRVQHPSEGQSRPVHKSNSGRWCQSTHSSSWLHFMFCGTIQLQGSHCRYLASFSLGLPSKVSYSTGCILAAPVPVWYCAHWIALDRKLLFFLPLLFLLTDAPLMLQAIHVVIKRAIGRERHLTNFAGESSLLWFFATRGCHRPVVLLIILLSWQLKVS